MDSPNVTSNGIVDRFTSFFFFKKMMPWNERLSVAPKSPSI
ncbi:Uncharacterized protein APZ42_016528 [Daphnia magna]|uniref:Uncharacterized protein n=1 Tax=Daphnia magna TaxID=35525 RepID=A0A165AG28_9CRUS|nr:Uncharacterized protein APZ42_016528 [Daphnia magna]